MSEFPRTLKAWRTRRRYSQLDLALEARVSARHVSFLETGRARPSPEMVARLGEALDMPLEARNQMLTHAGFAARYPGRKWDAEEMAPIRRAVDRLLERHMPYPALAVDRLWTVLEANAAARWLFGALGCGVGDSLLDLMLSDRLPEVIENFPDVAHHAASRLRTESAAQGGVAELDRVSEVLFARSAAGLSSGDDRVGSGPPPASPGPVIPTIMRLGEQRLALFATIAQFGTPGDVALDDLKIELYFPLDEPSREILERFAADPA
ncbi:MAG: helix-turn-helix transcriptional regulator [Pseudomonadota bacterium]